METQAQTNQNQSAPSPQPVKTDCCPVFDPAPWQEQEFTWSDRPFIKHHVRSLFHVPFNLDELYRKEQARISAAHAHSVDDLVLADETSLFGVDYYFAIDKKIPGAEIATFSGTYLSKVFDGPYSKIPSWIRQMKEFVASRGKKAEHLYFWYTTCPKCAKVYGKNPVVLFAKVAP